MTTPDPRAYLRFRPDHPDVERIAEITRNLDWLSDHGAGRVDPEIAFEDAVRGCGVDLSSLSYVSVQRAMMASGVKTTADLIPKQGDVTKMSSAWLEGFIVGARFTKEQHDRVWREKAKS